MAFRDELLLFRQARKAVQQHRVHDGVEDVFWGAAYKDKVETGRMAIRFNVKKKKARSGLKVSEFIPAKINGLPTDVTEFRFKNHTRTEIPYDRIRPLLGGVQVQPASSEGPLEWGTLGCQLLFNGIVYGISNEHVLAGNVNIADGVYQPKKALFGELVGTIAGIGDAALDYRLVRMTEQFDRGQSLNGLNGLVNGYLLPAGMNELRLVKAGAASGITKGIYDGRSLLEPHRVTIRSLGAGHDPVDRSSSRQALSLPGDSGAMWVNDDGQGRLRMFALHTGGDEEGRIALATLYASIHSSVHRQLRKGLT